jgi:hypothetical protein
MTEPREVWIETEVGDIGIVGAFGKLGLGLVVRSGVSRKDFNRLAKGIGWSSIKGVERFDDGPVMVMSGRKFGGCLVQAFLPLRSPSSERASGRAGNSKRSAPILSRPAAASSRPDDLPCPHG